MADSISVAQQPSKSPPALNPPKDDLISVAQLAECDGKPAAQLLPSGLVFDFN